MNNKNILREQFLSHIGQTSPSPLLIEVERAEGIYLYTPEGRAFYDLVAGVSVSNVGHSNPKVKEAIKAQVDSYMHTMVYGETVQRVQVEYAKMICGYLPQNLNNVYFVNSGAEAIEGAMKLAKRTTGRGEIISMVGAYHGSTQGALSIQGGEFYKTAFRPLLPNCRQIRFNSLEDLELITSATAGVVCEAVQGEAGIVLPNSGYLKALENRCKEVGALLIVDEIQTGFGRSGEMFAITKYGVTPDIVCLAKALGGGLPLGAFVSSREIMSNLQHDPVLGHITTFGGNPVCCAAGLAAMKYIIEESILEKVESLGALFEEELKGVDGVLEIRRSGLIMAVELGSSDKLFAIMDSFMELGIMSDWFLWCDTAFRISPPLVITKEEVLEVSRLIKSALTKI